MDIIALLLSRRKHLKLEQLIEKAKLIPDIEERIKARNIQPKPIVKFESSKKNESSESSSSDNNSEDETAGTTQLVSEQVKKNKKLIKKKLNDRGNWTEWAMVDIEADRKFFDMVDGAAEEIRIQQKNTAEAIATLDFGNIVINDPLTGESVGNLKHIVEDMRVDIFSIWTQGENFNADDYLRSVHFDTNLETFKQGMKSIREKLDSVDSSE